MSENTGYLRLLSNFYYKKCINCYSMSDLLPAYNLDACEGCQLRPLSLQYPLKHSNNRVLKSLFPRRCPTKAITLDRAATPASKSVLGVMW
jgi:hypothetical protein